ncbi:hypothetical protein DFH09DRAFT_1321054 [Mycena vulgaris]|nr:hypothetical protein DFH09DRAFT_1321054 [Mycena vulgaris]
MSPAFPVVRFTALTTALVGLGYLLLKTTVANEEEAYKRLSPGDRKRVDEARALRAAQEAEIRARVFAKVCYTAAGHLQKPANECFAAFTLFPSFVLCPRNLGAHM